MNKAELEKAIADEVAEWPGVSVEFAPSTGGNKPKAKLKFGELMLSRPYSGTPSDARRGLHNTIADMRRVMRQLGAERPKPEPSEEELEKRYIKPNEGAALRDPLPHVEKATPKPDVPDQLAEKGIISPEAAKAAQAARAAPLLAAPAEADEGESEEEREERLAALQAQIAAIVNGIYFDLPDHIYHAVPALGSGSICDLIVSPATFWRGSWLDPNRPELDEEATKAQIIGKAYHIARLEPERFDVMYVRKLSKADFPAKGLLSSDDKVKAQLKAHGVQQTVSGESMADRAQRLLDCGYEGTIMTLENARWEAQAGGRIPLDAKVYDEIVIDMDRVRASGQIAEKLSGGFAEVSVFWTDEHGLRCKCRFDYLLPWLWDDFKTFENSRGKKLAQAIADAFRYNRYYVQAIHYRDGAEAIRTGGLQIIGDASDEQRALIAAIQIRPSELECWYIMQEKGGVPNLLERRFEFFALPLGRAEEIDAMARSEAHAEAARAGQLRRTGIHSLGRAEIEQAKRDFHLYASVYQPGQPWAPIEPSGTIGDLDFNQFWLEGRG